MKTCPKCGGNQLATERRPNGFTQCLSLSSCGHRWRDEEKAQAWERARNAASCGPINVDANGSPV